MNLPNKITVMRIILIPFFLIVAGLVNILPSYDFGWGIVYLANIIAMIIFAVASITDFLDGYIARRDNLVTNFGKFADPVADKMLVMSALIVLTEQGLCPAWVAALIVCREIAVTALRILLVETGEVLAAAWPGKVKTTTQMLAVIFLLVGVNLVGTILLYVCLLATLYSGFEYFSKNRQVFSDGL
ncbi:MAG: CDP-diacylglycerol--glycerol-3-phosphate 3-phosphatidyltransferase [Lactobacillales bacterium]|nr:CDP-diacylglycerol--glycerol-3-phosphate 3-phosphatidyltransferase [Lactobacillales bacterium]